MQEVKKIDMALQQLEDALAAYFGGRYYSALVLAAAAEQLFGGYLHLHGINPAFSRLRTSIVKIANALKEKSGSDAKPTTERDIGDLLNNAYNQSHHAGKTGLELLMNPRFEARETLDRAISNFNSLLSGYELPDLPLVERFLEEAADEITIEKEVQDVLSPVCKTSET
ncbi:conserved hypothetical protein [Limnobacter sp. 130]|uniref:hypothetical protein n=1 Tax=Limnobacter sp. 130 TaxID=2653147 RepID=UPI0012F192AE|nr:hypothetical protein [Limnobacter sp. 130]VWX34069.1 conserved hypothetical protein [Limnobacter sp. 130]